MLQNVLHGSAATDEICVPQLRWSVASLSWQSSVFNSRAVCHVGLLMNGVVLQEYLGFSLSVTCHK
jgi:hypothetical protein